MGVPATPKSSKIAYNQWENQWFGVPIFQETSIFCCICVYKILTIFDVMIKLAQVDSYQTVPP